MTAAPPGAAVPPGPHSSLILIRPRRVVGHYAPLPQWLGAAARTAAAIAIRNFSYESSDRSGPVLGATREYLAPEPAREQLE